MTDRSLIRSLGQEPPLLADGRRAPDRREISLRWLSGTFLTGITSSILMGVALFAALDGRQQLAIPAEAFATANPATPEQTNVRRAGRLFPSQIAAKPTDRTILEVSTMVFDGEKEVVRRQPFAHVKMNLAANHAAPADYPPFDPLAIFAIDEKAPTPGNKTGIIYGSDVESEVSLKTIAFPAKGAPFAFAPTMSLEEIEENVRSNGSVLTDGSSQVAALYYVDPQRFADSNDDDVDIGGLTARIVEENMTVSAPEPMSPKSPEYADDIIPVRQPTQVVDAMFAAGYAKDQGSEIESVLSTLTGDERLEEGDVLRIGVMQIGERANIVRASLYRNGQHVDTAALDDSGRFVRGTEPPMLAAVLTAFDDGPAPVLTGSDLPRVYDGIYRAALSYGMSAEMTQQVVRLLASNVDFQAKLKPSDTIEAFFSVSDENGNATADSELLFVDARFGDNETRFYRFQDADGTIDYYDDEGKSIRQFLLRNPVPNGVFKSSFGMRRHPILGFTRMHTGVDWAAPRGTPIIAAGNGTVEKAGWDSGGYGNQTLIRHANGYVSSYNHQSAIAKGVRKGAKVRQGQVIGWIGTTGLSTGPHLHYELIVNGTKVDPMKIRLPGGKSLEGETLARFTKERDRIVALLKDDNAKQVASR